MAENETLPLEWDEVDGEESEEISAEDQAGSDDISNEKLIGKALCKITRVFPIEKDMKAYACIAVTLEHTIMDVLEAEMPVFGDDKKQLVRNGEPVFKVRPLTDEEKVKVNKKFIGTLLGSDEIFMYHVSEKPNTKRRRLYIAKNIRIMAPDANTLKMGDWQYAEGKLVIVSSERNRWRDKVTKEWMESGTKISWDGYSLAGLSEDTIKKEEVSSADEDYDDI